MMEYLKHRISRQYYENQEICGLFLSSFLFYNFEKSKDLLPLSLFENTKAESMIA